MNRWRPSILLFLAAICTGIHARAPLAEAAGKYLGGVVMAQEFKDSPCGRDIKIARKWLDFERAMADVSRSIPTASAAELQQASDFVQGKRAEFRSMWKDPRGIGKCEQLKGLFWRLFDDSVTSWEEAKRRPNR